MSGHCAFGASGVSRCIVQNVSRIGDPLSWETFKGLGASHADLAETLDNLGRWDSTSDLSKSPAHGLSYSPQAAFARALTLAI